MAFEGEDRGRFFGRGGRNIQAMRSALEGIAKIADQSICLDVYGFQGGNKNGDFGSNSAPPGRGGLRSNRGPSSRTPRSRPARSRPYRERS